LGAGAALTSDYDKTVIDVINAAMSRFDVKHRLAILTGIMVLICKEHDVAPQALHGFIDARINEFEETFEETFNGG
jgi:hypothetical protein